jgi:hypothetical protein
MLKNLILRLPHSNVIRLRRRQMPRQPEHLLEHGGQLAVRQLVRLAEPRLVPLVQELGLQLVGLLQVRQLVQQRVGPEDLEELLQAQEELAGHALAREQG